MVEKNLQSIFSAWVKANRDKIPSTTVWELKMEKGTSFAFDRVADHQIEALLDAKHTGMYHKISDTPVSWGGKMRFTSKKPLDCMLIKNAEAFVVLCFYTPRKPKETLWIDVDRFIEVRDQSPRKSIQEAEARLIAHRVEIIRIDRKLSTLITT